MNVLQTRLKSAEDLHAMRGRAVAEQQRAGRRVRVCLGTGCMAKGSADVIQEFRRAAGETDQGLVVGVKCTGCQRG